MGSDDDRRDRRDKHDKDRHRTSDKHTSKRHDSRDKRDKRDKEKEKESKGDRSSRHHRSDDRHRDRSDDHHHHRDRSSDDRHHRDRDHDRHRDHREDRDRHRSSKRSRSPHGHSHSTDKRSSRKEDTKAEERVVKLSSKFGDKIDLNPIAPPYPGGAGGPNSAFPPSFNGGNGSIHGGGSDFMGSDGGVVGFGVEEDPINQMLFDEYLATLGPNALSGGGSPAENFTSSQETVLTVQNICIGGKRVGLPPQAQQLFKSVEAADPTSKIVPVPLARPITSGGGALVVVNDGSQPTLLSGGQNGGPSAALIEVTAPLISPELTRAARENRRMHVTGFPKGTPKSEVEFLVEEWCAKLRREITTRELLAAGVAEDKLPAADTVFSTDRILETFIDDTKEKPFAFIELNTNDMVDAFTSPRDDRDPIEMVTADGRAFPIHFGRPRDFKHITTGDQHRLLIQGFKGTEQTLRRVIEKYTTPVELTAKDGYAFVEFETEKEAQRVIELLHGFVMSKSVVIAQPLSDVMRAFLISIGIKVNPTKAIELEDEALKEEDDVLSEVLKLTTPLPALVGKLHAYYDHLRPLFGSVVPIYPTRILVLLNIVDDLDLASDEAFSALSQKIADEVERHGRVKNLIIPRLRPRPAPPQIFHRKVIPRPPPTIRALPLNSPFGDGHGDGSGAAVAKTAEEIEYDRLVAEQDALQAAFESDKASYHRRVQEWEDQQLHPVYGGFRKIFVEYETVEEAANAQKAVCGRTFCNRTVVTSFLFEDILYPPEGEEEENQPAESDMNYTEEDAAPPPMLAIAAKSSN